MNRKNQLMLPVGMSSVTLPFLTREPGTLLFDTATRLSKCLRVLGVTLTPRELIDKANQLGVGAFTDWLETQIPFKKKAYEHVNWVHCADAFALWKHAAAAMGMAQMGQKFGEDVEKDIDQIFPLLVGYAAALGTKHLIVGRKDLSKDPVAWFERMGRVIEPALKAMADGSFEAYEVGTYSFMLPVLATEPGPLLDVITKQLSDCLTVLEVTKTLGELIQKARELGTGAFTDWLEQQIPFRRTLQGTAKVVTNGASLSSP